MTELVKILQSLVDELAGIRTIMEKSQEKTFYSIQDLAEEMGISEDKARQIFNDPDFPDCTYPKAKKAHRKAIEDYFSVKRTEDDSKYWRDLKKKTRERYNGISH